jgi:hypothetical protein
MFIEKIENFLSEETYEWCNNTSNEILTLGSNDSVPISAMHIFNTHHFWDKNIVKDSFPVLIHFIDRQSELYFTLKEEIEEKTNCFIKKQANIMFYYWTRFSYIPWHNDGLHDFALTIHLNEKWDENYGGWFLYEENGGVSAILPKRNMGVFQKGGIRHCTTPVHYDGNLRRTIQVFLSAKKE